MGTLYDMWSDWVDVVAGTTVDAIASCSDGDVAISGGFMLDGDAASILASHRVEDGAWTAQAQAPPGINTETETDTARLRAQVICAG